jgi:hypothetical protein
MSCVSRSFQYHLASEDPTSLLARLRSGGDLTEAEARTVVDWLESEVLTGDETPEEALVKLIELPIGGGAEQFHANHDQSTHGNRAGVKSMKPVDDGMFPADRRYRAERSRRAGEAGRAAAKKAKNATLETPAPQPLIEWRQGTDTGKESSRGIAEWFKREFMPTGELDVADVLAAFLTLPGRILMPNADQERLLLAAQGMRVFHLQGQHDQKDHGRRAGATGDTGDTGSVFEVEGFDPAAAKAKAKEMRAQAEAAEPEITARLSQMVGDSDPATYETPSSGAAELYGYEFRLKAEDKIAEKIARKMVEDNVGFEEASQDIKDTVRYTVHFTEEEFGPRAQSVIDELRAENPGVRVKNTWPPETGVAYKGVNVQVTREDGLRFEVQFHTPGSQSVKDRMHTLYEQQRVLPPNSPRWEQLEQEMVMIGNEQPVPRDAGRVFRVARHGTLHVVSEEL